METMQRQTEAAEAPSGPMCLVPSCEQRTRSLLAVPDGRREERERRVINFVVGGQPPELIHL